MFSDTQAEITVLDFLKGSNPKLVHSLYRNKFTINNC